MRIKSFSNYLSERLAIEDVPLQPASKPCTIFTGRFSPPTKAHCGIVEKLYKDYGLPVIIFIIRSDSGKNASIFPVEVQKTIFNASLDIPHKVMIASEANILLFLKLLRDDGYEPTVFACGTDRVKGYATQIDRYKDKFNYNIKLAEIIRDMNSKENISGTNVRNSLANNDFETFKSNMAKGAWSLFDDLKRY